MAGRQKARTGERGTGMKGALNDEARAGCSIKVVASHSIPAWDRCEIHPQSCLKPFFCTHRGDTGKAYSECNQASILV